MITDYRLNEIQARPLYKLSGWVYKAGNTNYGVESARDFQLTEDDFSASGNTIRVEGGEGYPIGSAVCKTCTLTLKASSNYSASDFNGACIELMIKAYNSIGSWAVTGDYYFVQTVKKTGGQIILECADFMSKANVPYKRDSYAPSTATLRNLFADVCRKCGVTPLSGYSFKNSSFTYTINAWQKFNSYTCRQMLGFIATIAGGNALAIAGGTGFKISSLDSADENPLYQWSQFTDEAESVKVTGVEMTENTDLAWRPVEDPDTYKSSTYSGDYVLDLTETANPLFKGRDQQAVDLIMSAVSGLTLRNFSGDHIGWPLAEYGDRAAITHRGGTMSSFITEFEWNVSGATTFACNVKSSVANGETYPSGSGPMGTSGIDYITEQGASGNWNYRKWNSGYAECWAAFQAASVAVTGTWGSLFYGSIFTAAEAKQKLAYPFAFTSAPCVQAGISHTATGTGDCWMSTDYGKKAGAPEQYAPPYSLVRATSGTVTNAVISYCAKGKWK